MSEKTAEPGDPGTCGFCGTGDGWLGDQGDESTQYLHSSVRTGDPGEWKYEKHPGALKRDKQYIIWCGNCIGGLKHKFQRLDDHNLRAEHTALSLWQQLDGPRWATWNPQDPEEEAAFKKVRDDPAVHLEKLGRESRINDLQNELFRRAGFDLTTRGWRA
jgi:hypothetical protein